MDRREAISRVAWLLGGTIVGANLFMEVGCQSPSKKVNELFNEDQVNMLNEVGETILPATSSPGAKAANVGPFMAVMVKDCYTERDQKVFLDGLDKLEKDFDEKYGSSFAEATADKRTEFLTALDAEQKKYTETKKEEDSSHYFRMIKELTLLGFFTSEVGCTKAQRYVDVPGKYDGNVPYKKGDKAWAAV